MPRQSKGKAMAKAREKAEEEEAARNAQTSTRYNPSATQLDSALNRNASGSSSDKFKENQAPENNSAQEPAFVHEKPGERITGNNAACPERKEVTEEDKSEKAKSEIARERTNVGSSRKSAEEPESLPPSQLESRKQHRVEGLNPAANESFNVRNSGEFQGRGGYGGEDAKRGGEQGWNQRGGRGRGRDYEIQGGGGGGRGKGRGYEYQRGGDYERRAGGGDSKRVDALARALSSVLRHKAPHLRLNVRSDGYVVVKDLLSLGIKTQAGIPLHSHSVEDLKEAVARDNKQRFGLREENGQLLIRANQGHSIKTINSEDLLEHIVSTEEVPVCLHGTYLKNLESIKKEGLKRMSRLHIHFATGLDKEEGVISGMRSSCEVLIHLNVQKALDDGMKLYRSENGVILTEGFDGVIPPKYFKKIEEVGQKRNKVF